MGSLGTIWAELTLKLNEFDAELKRAEASIQKAGRDLENQTRSIGTRMQSALASAEAGSKALLFGLVGLGTGLVAAGGAGVKMAAQMEQATIAFTTLLGSASKARSFLEELWQFAAETPFEFGGLQQSARQLLAYGFNAKEIIPMLTAVGDAVSALGGGAVEIERVGRALGQMRAKGKVSAEEMMQLAELGIPVWELLARKIGISIPEAMDRASKGAIPAAQGIEAILSGLTERFGGAMDEQSKTILGRWSTTKDNLSALLRSVGAELINAFDLGGVLQNLNEHLSRFVELVQAEGLKGALAELVPPDLRLKLVVIAGAIAGALVPALYSLAVGIWAAMAPLLPFIAAGAAVAALAYLIVANWEPIKAFFLNTWLAVRDATAAAVGWLQSLWGGFVNWFGGAWQVLKAFLAEWGPYLLSALAGPLGPVVVYIIKHWDDIKEGCAAALGAVVQFFRELPGRIWELIVSIPGRIGAWAADMGRQVWEGFKGALGIHSPSYVEKALTSMADTAEAEFGRMVRIMKEWEPEVRDTARRVGDSLKLIPEELKKAVDQALATVEYLGSESEKAFRLWQLTVGATATETQKLTAELAAQKDRLAELGAAIPDLEKQLKLMERAFGADSEQARDLRLKLLDLRIEQAELQAATAETTAKLEAQVGALKDLVVEGDRVKLLVEGPGGSKVWLNVPRRGPRPEYSAEEQEEINAISERQGVDVGTAAFMARANQVARAIGEIPRYALGGIVNNPSLAWIAETPRARPEVVSPLGDLLNIIRKAIPAQPAGPVTILVQLDGRTIARLTAPHLVRELRLKGVPA